MQLDQQELLLYAKQIALTEIGVHGQLKLKQSRVLCIGAGGLGSPLLQYLAAAGVGTLGIIDDDKVELSNLQRQIIYNHDDIGKLKVVAARDYLRKLNPHIKIEIFPERFDIDNASKLVAQYDVIVDCTDQLTNRYLVNAICFAYDKPFAFAGIWRHRGQCMLFHGKHGPCFACVFPRTIATETLPTCSEAGVLGVLPGILGSLQANLVIQHILQLSRETVGCFYLFDLIKMEMHSYKAVRQKDCPVCVMGQRVDLISELACGAINKLTAISAAELMQKIASSEEFLLLDVRSPAEHATANLGGMLIPLPELTSRISELNCDKPVVIYCQCGPRSIAAGHLLCEHEFSSVAYLKGGLVGWQA